MSEEFTVVIPARYASSRLLGKPLLKIGDRTLIEHVYRAACMSDASEVIIATDDQGILDVVNGFGARGLLTSTAHQSGSDRIAEVVDTLALGEDHILVNLQGDEFGISPEIINTVSSTLVKNVADMATLCHRITDSEDYLDRNVVKVVFDRNNRALYFSRSPVPWSPVNSGIEGIDAYKHIGIYAYRAGFLKIFTGLFRPKMEKQESLEQLRALYHDYRVYVETVDYKGGIEVNTEADLGKARGKLD